MLRASRRVGTGLAEWRAVSLLHVEETLSAVKIFSKKSIALAEAGYEQIPYPKWWTETLMNAIGNHHISYVIIWRNHDWNKDMNPPHMHYYAPYSGQVSADDFKQFHSLDKTLFEKDAKKEEMYR